MKILLTADWHLVDTPLEDYRWDVFNKIQTIIEHEDVDRIIIAGDIVDRKDRHSGVLLNKLSRYLCVLSRQIKVSVLAGNHDAPITSDTPYYWDVLNNMGVEYITKPSCLLDVWLLPFSANPMEEWKELKFELASTVIMHQTIEGAITDGGYKVEKTPNPLPIFPRGLSLYSGDVHRPQRIHGITYIGTPHPTRFSEDWPNRILLVDTENPAHFKEVDTTTVRRGILNISSVDELTRLSYKKGDQVKIQYSLSGQDLTLWQRIEDDVRMWAAVHEVTVASCEPTLVESAPMEQLLTGNGGLEQLTSEQIVRMFGAEQNLSDDLIQEGVSLIRSAA